VSDVQIFIAALLVSVAVLNAIANWVNVPYPIVLVIGGLALGLVPGIPEIQLEPRPRPADLPAAAALLGRLLRRPDRAAQRPADDFAALDRPGAGDGSRGRRPCRPGDRLPIAVSYALGAIVAPTDAIAAGGIAIGLVVGYLVAEIRQRSVSAPTTRCPR
jgi:CPA1 family monovalent cation:H+ antiporter